jgi:hypothetical protein
MYAEIVSAIESAKTLRELLKAASSLSNYNELVAAVSEVNARLMDSTAVALASQEKQSELAQQVRELQEEVRKLTDWEPLARNYALKEVAAGVFSYVYTSSTPMQQPKHWACAKCFQDRKLSVLQRQLPPTYLCQSCGSKITPYKNGSLVSIKEVY